MERNQKALFPQKRRALFYRKSYKTKKNSQKNIGREQHHEVHYESSRKKRRENYDDVF